MAINSRVKDLKENHPRSASKVWARIIRFRPFAERMRRRRRYRYIAAFLVGVLLGAVVTESLQRWRQDTYADCILKYIPHSGSTFAAAKVQEACAEKYAASAP